MALSSWDSLAFDNDGNAISASFPKDDYVLSIYKNYLAVRKGEDRLGSMEYGEGHIGPFCIHAKHVDEQNAIFVYAYYWHNEENRRVDFCGIGAYGYKSELKWMEEKHPEEYARMMAEFPPEEGWEYFSTYSRFGGGEESSWGFTFLNEDNPEGEQLGEWDVECEESTPEETWTGVTSLTLEKFKEWLKEVEPEYFERIDFRNALRYNQGDGYFSDNLDTELSATPIGEAETPMIHGIINAIFPKSDEVGTGEK